MKGNEWAPNSSDLPSKKQQLLPRESILCNTSSHVNKVEIWIFIAQTSRNATCAGRLPVFSTCLQGHCDVQTLHICSSTHRWDTLCFGWRVWESEDGGQKLRASVDSFFTIQLKCFRNSCDHKSQGKIKRPWKELQCWVRKRNKASMKSIQCSPCILLEVWVKQ